MSASCLGLTITRLTTIAGAALLASVSFGVGCASDSGTPTAPSTPGVPTTVVAEIRLPQVPAIATSVSILFGYPAQNGFSSVPGRSSATPYGCSAIPLNSSGIYACSAILRSDMVPSGRYGVKAIVHLSGQLDERLCEPMFANGLAIPCTGRDPFGDYAKFIVTAEGSVIAGGY